MFCKRIRECGAGLNFCCYLLKYLLEGLIFHLLSKGLDPSEEGDTGGKECRKLTGKDYNVLGADPGLKETYCCTLFFGFGLAFFQRNGYIAHFTQLKPGHIRIRCVYGANYCFAHSVSSFVTKS